MRDRVVTFALRFAVLCIALPLVYLHLCRIAPAKSVEHNNAANLYPVQRWLKGDGAPYRDYWVVYPPATFAVFAVHEWAFGGALPAYKAVHLGLCMWVLWVTLGLIDRLLRPATTWVVARAAVFLWCCLLFFSYHLHSVCMSNVLIGLAFALPGLALAGSEGGRIGRCVVATFLLSVAGFVKDPFLFAAATPAIISLIGRGKQPGRGLDLAGCAVGWLACLGVQFALVTWWDAWGDQISLFHMKFNYFGIGTRDMRSPARWLQFYGNYFGHVFLGGRMLAGVLAAAALWVSRGLLLGNRDRLAAVLFFALNFIGFRLQGRISYTYCLQMTIPTVLLALAIGGMAWERLRCRGPATVTVAACLLSLVIPRPEVFATYAAVPFLSPLELARSFLSNPRHERDRDFPPAVFAALAKDDRMLVVYGWDSPVTLYHYGLRSYGRHFLVHPNIMGPEQRAEWASEFLRGLPRVVLYNDGPNADTDVRGFEAATIAVKRLLADFYDPAGEGYFVLRPGVDDRFRNHIADYVSRSVKLAELRAR